MTSEAEEVKSRLIQGNRRFMEKFSEDLPRHLGGQSPKVAVLTCSDSRVPVEHIFDLGIGDLFAIEVAGNVAIGESVLGSLDYAVEHLKVPLLLILGHRKCGAVKASQDGPGDDSPIGHIVNEIRCSFGTNDDEKANVLRQMELLPERSQAIKNAVESSTTIIMGAIYNLENGEIEWI